MLPDIGRIRPWYDPIVTALGRLRMHVPLDGHQRRSLDGGWQLELFASPDAVPAAALTGARPRSHTVAVPGNWTMQELGDDNDYPGYTNIQMPFAGPPPVIPDENPTGVYRRQFTLPKSWARRTTVLHVGGAESTHTVFVNGDYVGYGTDSRLPSEYDITDHVEPGDNEVAIVVTRYGAHSYIEDQDQWWMAGLHRSIWVESLPQHHIADLPIDVDFDPETSRGTLRVRTEVSPVDEVGWTVRTTVHAPNGKQVGPVRSGEVPHVHAKPYVFTGFTVEAEWSIARARPWSAESPDRYEVTVELLSPRGKVVDAQRQLVGLRRVEMRDRQLLVNGKPIWVFGVNRHDHHPERGKAVTVDDMRADLELMRRLNITAVRTSHYPNDPAFYDLCDELGFYVIDEANIESHGYNWSICDDARYRPAWLERGSRMVERDRNHPSIIMWSLGNESGYGSNHDALAGWIRRVDPSRPLHYEDAIRIAGWVEGGLGATDVVCPMYATIDEVRAYGEAGDGNRPLIMCEYNHAMGNSNGSLADYWDVFTSTPGLQGGFIWEWKDHGLRRTLPDGSTRVAYGGMFGEEPHDANFVADGLVSCDLEPHPAGAEVTWVHRPVTVERRGGELAVTNRRSFTDLADLTARWQFLADDGSMSSGRLKVPKVGPGDVVEIPIPASVTGDGWLTITWETKRDQWFAPAGHLTAWDQIIIGSPATPPATAIVSDGEQPWSEPQLSLWRAPIDNDGFKLMPELSRRLGAGGESMVRWEQAGLDRRPADELVDHRHDIDIGDEGVVHRHQVEIPDELADLARIGVSFRLPGRYRWVRWFGRGPHENYPDRNRSATLGIWEGPLDECPYLVPQEYGLRTDCGWIELSDPDRGDTIRIDRFTPGTLHASATPYTAAELAAAPHADRLESSGDTIVHLDVAHRGVGTASCGPDTLDRYRVDAGSYEFGYRLSAGRR